jgi:hypothetical protein
MTKVKTKLNLIKKWVKGLSFKKQQQIACDYIEFLIDEGFVNISCNDKGVIKVISIDGKVI